MGVGPVPVGPHHRADYSFDNFFDGEKWANLRANATVGSQASELMEKLTSLQRSVIPPDPPTPVHVDLTQGPSKDLPADEEMAEEEESEIDALVSTGVAEAYEEAKAAGKELSADELKEVLKKKRAAAKKNVKAAGKFQVIQRSKKTIGVPTLLDANGVVAS